MNTERAVVIGADKIGRGLIAHLLTLSGYQLAFVEKDAELVALLRERREYRVRIWAAPKRIL
jgi:mannitol-1-phosphate 5-dehydrogenase